MPHLGGFVKAMSNWGASAVMTATGGSSILGANSTTSIAEMSTNSTSNTTTLWDINEECQIHHVELAQRCTYARQVIDCKSASSVQYLEFTYCDIPDATWFAYILFSAFLVYLFLNLVLVLDTRVVPNINSIARTTRMSDSLAGVTLLACGNGAADIFSAAAAVHASPQHGTTLAISGLLGGGLFVMTVVAGVLALKFEPSVSLRRNGRDTGGYAISVISVGIICWFGFFTLWECVCLLLLYAAYVAYVAYDERQFYLESQAIEADEKSALLIETPRGGNPMYEQDEEAAFKPKTFDPILKFTTKNFPTLLQPTEASTPFWPDHDGSWTMTFERIWIQLFETYSVVWDQKSTLSKVVIILRLPVHLAVLLTTPIMHFDDPKRGWDRNLIMLNMFFMCPFMALIFNENAFYTYETVNIPKIVLAMIVGLVLAMFVRTATEIDRPPKFQWWFALIGFVVSLTWIYTISDEIVAVLRTCGMLAGVSSALIGMTVLGIGNGFCDLTANYLMASAGHPSTAIAAIYAGPMFNLLVGLSIAGIFGSINQKDHRLPVDELQQVYLGIIFILVALVLGVTFSVSGAFTKNTAICLFAVYFLFLMTTATLYA